jgi:hypothetical protein
MSRLSGSSFDPARTEEEPEMSPVTEWKASPGDHPGDEVDAVWDRMQSPPLRRPSPR